MDTLLSLLIGLAVTFFFLRRYLRGLNKPNTSRKGDREVAATPTEATSGNCPRCGTRVAGRASFCAACGAPLALWRVHQAAVQESPASEDEAGRPRPVINATLCIGCGSCVDECPETGTLVLAGGKAILADPARCTGQSRCVDVCPTSAISLAFGSTLQTMRVPSVNERFETNVPGVFIVGELGGMALIKTAINEGRLVMDHVRQRLEADGLWSPSSDHDTAPRLAAREDTSPDDPADVVIVGAGPAGISASLTAAQVGIRYVTVEQGEIASTIRQYPRQKFLMAEPIEMPLYGNLYIGDGTKEALLAVWESIIANTGIHVRTQERVDAVTRDPERGIFEVSTSRGRIYGRFVILALGKRGTPRKLGVRGEDLGKVAYRLIEADTYQGCDVLVVGGGDSAIEAALALAKDGRNRVALSYRKDTFSRARDRNRESLAEAEDDGRVLVMRQSAVEEIRDDRVVLESGAERVELPNDFVFVMIGGESPEAFLQKVGVEIVEKAIAS